MFEPPTWRLFVDGSFWEIGYGTRVIFVSPEGHKLNCVIRFGFKVSNNAAEYEVLLADLRLSREIQVKRLMVSSDSQLLVSQARVDFATRDNIMASYLKKVMVLFSSFEKLN